jgi:argininosuccinate lyase
LFCAFAFFKACGSDGIMKRLSPAKSSKKAWSGRIAAAEHPLMERFNASIGFDFRLYREDIAGSLTHAGMLREIGLLSTPEHDRIAQGLKQVEKEIESGDFKPAAACEDIHMAVESRLTQLIGALGGKLHTARSRNDQVALDTRLFVRAQNRVVIERLTALQDVMVGLARKNQGVILPGYTHLQRAQPVLLAHHLLAYFEMFERDVSRFADALARLDQCPLGAGALAGSPIAINREVVAKALGFTAPTHNSLDSVSDRDFVLDFLASAAILMMHLSRLCEELVLWSSQEFGFARLPEGFCTGSSMMPQKVNPDAPELIRGKSGRVFGHLVALLTVMKGLPLAYNKDMQEDKEALFDAADTTRDCLDVLIQMLPGIQFDAGRMRQALQEGFLLATDLADYLVGKGLPFREAHAVVGGLVRRAIEQGCGLENLDLKTLKKFSNCFQADVSGVLSVTASVDARRSFGGTAGARVKAEIKRAERILRIREGQRGPKKT